MATHATRLDAARCCHYGLLELAVSHSSAILYIADTVGERPFHFVGFNVEAITGHKASRFLEEAGFVSRHIHPGDLPTYKLGLEELRDREALTQTYRFRSGSGEYRWYRDHMRLIDGADGREDMLVGCMVELTTHDDAQAELCESQDLVRQVLESCPVPITLNRAGDGTIIYESPAARRLLGCRETQEGESVVDRWVEPDDRQAYLRRLRRTGAVDGLESRFKKADGQEFPCAVSSRLIDFRGEEVIVSNLLDLTEYREAGEELARQRERLHQGEKLSAMGELLAGVSHELNNPLSVLLGQAVMLQESASDQRTAERADKIHKAADRCARIVKTFLAMARQEPSTKTLVDLHAVIDSALEVTAYSLRTSGVEVSLPWQGICPRSWPTRISCARS